jgi:hypothetical protein
VINYNLNETSASIAGLPTFGGTLPRSRSATWENPRAERGKGGRLSGGRKGAPARPLLPGQTITLLDADGPGVLRHLWMALRLGPPEALRALLVEVRYDHLPDPSIAVPLPDLFGAPHGRPSEHYSIWSAVHEGRGFNLYLPMPFERHITVSLTNRSSERFDVYYQLDHSLGDRPADAGYLHATFRRENPTTLGRDFEILSGLEGPGCFVGCNIGVRPLDPGSWYGEGEVKFYLDGEDLPTICGTGLEDYVGTAWGLGQHWGPYGGAPLVMPRASEQAQSTGMITGDGLPELVGLYRWHYHDPIWFARQLRVTVQQIGLSMFPADEVDAAKEHEQRRPHAANWWWNESDGETPIGGLAERVDDYCSTAFVYCRDPQSVPVPTTDDAVADIEFRPAEREEREEKLDLIRRVSARMFQLGDTYDADDIPPTPDRQP